VSTFIEIDVVSGDASKSESFHTFPMQVRPQYIAAVNVVTDPPHEDVKSVVYFNAESGLKPILSSLTPEYIMREVGVSE
jgi:hypothetical protein